MFKKIQEYVDVFNGFQCFQRFKCLNYFKFFGVKFDKKKNVQTFNIKKLSKPNFL